MNRKKQNQLESYLIAIAMFIVATALGIILFSIISQRGVDALAKNKLMLNVSRQRSHFEEVLDVNYQYLDAAASLIGSDGVLISDKNMDIVSAIKSTTSIDHVALIEPDGTAHYENGEIKDVSHRSYVQEGLAGQHILSDPLQSSVDQETRVILGVPVYHDNTVIGILGASYNVTLLNHMMFDDLFDGEGLSIIINERGEIMTLDGHSTDQTICLDDNFFDFYGQWNLYGSSSLVDIRKAFQKQESGLVQLYPENNPEKSCYISFSPLHFNHWMICYVVPVSTATASYSFVMNYAFVLNAYFIILVFLLVWRIFVIHDKDHRELVHNAQIDALTDIYNKEHTQTAIDDFLANAQTDMLHAFLIMDIDKFKHVNDTYGHAAGDQILQQVGQFLKREFRDNDIIGRIGGDEFVVFMKNISSREAATWRVQNMVCHIRSIKQPAIDGNVITLSVGVAFCPEHGTQFDELYRNADKALYQAKRGGRNNFSVYQSV